MEEPMFEKSQKVIFVGCEEDTYDQNSPRCAGIRVRLVKGKTYEVTNPNWVNTLNPSYDHAYVYIEVKGDQGAYWQGCFMLPEEEQFMESEIRESLNKHLLVE